MDQFGSKYETPGWRRAQQRAGEAPVKKPQTIEGKVVGRAEAASGFAPGTRAFHAKFGPGTVAAVDGGKLTIDFDKAGRKLVLDSFVERRD
jgi:DNA helicase-2/ATP-dependent DNA helicase PcrA